VPWGKTTVFAYEHLLIVDGSFRRLEPPAGEDFYHSQPVQLLRALRDGRVLSLAGQRNTRVADKPAEILLWDIAAGRPTREALEPSNIVTTLLVSPDERRFVTVGALSAAGRPGFVHVWDAERFVRIAALTGHRENVTAVAFSPDGKTMATGDAGGFVRIWDVPQATSR
jgi:WD40 repeat protein